MIQSPAGVMGACALITLGGIFAGSLNHPIAWMAWGAVVMVIFALWASSSSNPNS